MTVIAFDGRYIAADSRCRLGNYITPRRERKLRRVDNIVYAITGYPSWFDAWISWHQQGEDPRAIPPCHTPPDDNHGSFVVLKAEGSEITVQYYSYSLPYAQLIAPPDAWGSGQEFAIGAMLWGASAMDACRVAIRATASCGGRIMAYDMLDLDGEDLTDLTEEMSHGVR